MDAPLKELARLEKLQTFPPSLHSTSSRATSKAAPSVSESLDSLLNSLQELKQRVEAGTTSEVVVQDVARLIEEKKKDLDERQKEVHGSLTKLGKAIDKKFTSPLPPFTAMFTSPESVSALERTIANHFVRTGQFGAADTFREVAGVDVNPTLKSQFLELHGILKALENENIEPALQWVNANRPFLASRSSSLEFNLHRSRFLRLLTSPSNPPMVALNYIRSISPTLYAAHAQEVHRLITCIVYLPLPKLMASPYADLASPALHMDLQPGFAKEYCASLGLSKQVPLRVVGDIGGGGALSRIEKGRKVMRERKSEWSQTNELPIEIPLPPENRYHSIFACPVSKEQSTEVNPPMMMGCGHVVAKDSLEKLKKSGGRVKCPYCPIESFSGNSVRVYF